MRFWKQCAGLLCVAVLLGRAEIIDRIAIIVDRQAIKDSDITEEIRVTSFLNKDKVDLSLAARKKSASRLIDQAILRKEMDVGNFVTSDEEEAARLLDQLRRGYPSTAAYQQALKSYEITEEQLKDRLSWQTQVLQFIKLRFGDLDAPSGQTVSVDVNKQFFAWLDETRKEAHIVYKEENLK